MTPPTINSVAKRLGYSKDRTEARCQSNVTDSDLSDLVCTPPLQKLVISGCGQLTDAGLIHLVKLTQLRKLVLSRCKQLSDTGFAHLVGLAQLKELTLCGCDRLTNAGLAHLKGLPQLQELSLAECEQLTDAGLVHLSGLMQLQTLILSKCRKLTGVGFAHLLRLPQLKELYLNGCDQVTNATVMGLKTAIPNLAIFGFDMIHTQQSQAIPIPKNGTEHLALSHEATVNMQDAENETPQHRAATIQNEVEVMECPVSFGADVNTEDNYDKAPLDSANTEEKHCILRETMEIVETRKDITSDRIGSMGDFEKLNDQQKQAVTTTEGYIRVIAGAGSGKTKALTHRFVYLANTLGIPSDNILCVTFTNKAAAEMKKRIRLMIGDSGVGLISTFHGFCVRLLKEDGHVLHYPPKFHILDEDDVNIMIEQCFEKMGITSKQMTVQTAKDHINGYKHQKSSTKFLEDYHYPDILTDTKMTKLMAGRINANNIIDKIVLEYLYEQRKAFALDFNDLISFALYILRTDENTRIKWQERLQYIMVDEFQDVSSDQYELASILSGYHKNLFVVGDPDQMIYSWRGAALEYILNFAKTFPNAQTINMNTNYRSSAKIINASNSLIRKNKNRIEKYLVPHREDDGHAVYFHAKTQNEEAEWIAKQIETLMGYGISLSKIAVLYRAHYVSRSIEEAMRKHRLPYTIFSGISFYQRREVKDVLGYLRLIHNDEDLAFSRIINKPYRGVGKKRMQIIRDHAEANNCSYLSALADNINTIDFKETGGVAFLELINKYKESHEKYSLTDLFNAILDESGYEEHLRKSGDEERLNTLAELKQSIQDYEITAGEETSLESYLHDIALYTNTDKQDETESIKLMTIHTAKGLEFPYVFVCGMNEGIFPSQKSNTVKSIEEERRLAYVAFTRAEDRLFLSDSEGTNPDGSFRYPSRFIFDTEQVNLDYIVPLPAHLIDQATNPNSNTHPDIDSDFFTIGSKVVHAVFGMGEIRAIDNEQSCYLIAFEKTATPRMIRFNTPLAKTE